MVCRACTHLAMVALARLMASVMKKLSMGDTSGAALTAPGAGAAFHTCRGAARPGATCLATAACWIVLSAAALAQRRPVTAGAWSPSWRSCAPRTKHQLCRRCCTGCRCASAHRGAEAQPQARQQQECGHLSCLWDARPTSSLRCPQPLHARPCKTPPSLRALRAPRPSLRAHLPVEPGGGLRPVHRAEAGRHGRQACTQLRLGVVGQGGAHQLADGAQDAPVLARVTQQRHGRPRRLQAAASTHRTHRASQTLRQGQQGEVGGSQAAWVDASSSIRTPPAWAHPPGRASPPPSPIRPPTTTCTRPSRLA